LLHIQPTLLQFMRDHSTKFPVCRSSGPNVIISKNVVQMPPEHYRHICMRDDELSMPRTYSLWRLPWPWL